MANSVRNQVQDGEVEPVAPWVQPTRYVACSTDDMGFFIKIPHLVVLDDIANTYGPAMANVWYRAAQRLFTYIGQSVSLSKDTPKTREAIQAAMEGEFAKFADATLTWKEKRGEFDTALIEVARPLLIEALAKIGKGPEYLDQAFTQYYEFVVDKFGPTVAAAGYTPMKKGPAAKKVGSEALPTDLFAAV